MSYVSSFAPHVSDCFRALLAAEVTRLTAQSRTAQSRILGVTLARLSAHLPRRQTERRFGNTVCIVCSNVSNIASKKILTATRASLAAKLASLTANLAMMSTQLAILARQ